MEAETDDRDLYSGIGPGSPPQRVMNGAAESLGDFEKKLTHSSTIASFGSVLGNAPGFTNLRCGEIPSGRVVR
jgi:hypothetical protein